MLLAILPKKGQSRGKDKKLKNQDNAKEYEFRTAISRAQTYAFVYLKLEYKDDKWVKFVEGYGDKWALRQLFYNANKRHLAEQWGIYSKERDNAEYNMDIEFNKNDADEYIVDIEQFIEEVKNEVILEKDT